MLLVFNFSYCSCLQNHFIKRANVNIAVVYGNVPLIFRDKNLSPQKTISFCNIAEFGKMVDHAMKSF